MEESQAFVDILSFCRGCPSLTSAREQAAPQIGGVASWPETMLYLLRNYAKIKHISQAIKSLQYLRHRPDETERKLSKSLKNVIGRCGNFH